MTNTNKIKDISGTFERAELLSSLSAYDHGDGCLWIIVDQALADDPDVSVDEVRAIVIEAENDAAARAYAWKTDAAHGTIEALSIEDAIAKLVADREWPTAAHVADGSWAWVESPNGERQAVGKVP